MWPFKKKPKIDEKVISRFEVDSDKFWEMVREHFKDQIPEEHTKIVASKLDGKGFGCYKFRVILEESSSDG